jgi:hypothetical protein
VVGEVERAAAGHDCCCRHVPATLQNLHAVKITAAVIVIMDRRGRGSCTGVAAASLRSDAATGCVVRSAAQGGCCAALAAPLACPEEAVPKASKALAQHRGRCIDSASVEGVADGDKFVGVVAARQQLCINGGATGSRADRVAAGEDNHVVVLLRLSLSLGGSASAATARHARLRGVAAAAAPTVAAAAAAKSRRRDALCACRPDAGNVVPAVAAVYEDAGAVALPIGGVENHGGTSCQPTRIGPASSGCS